MAIKAKVFRHTSDQACNIDNDSAGLAKDIEDYITATDGDAALDATTNLNVTSWSVGHNIFTLVVLDDGA